MQQTCPRCGNASNTNSRFCTNCGNVVEAAQPYQQSWQAPPVQNQAPPWAQAQGGAYQGQAPGLGFGGQSDAQAKKLLQIAGIVIGSALLLLIVCIALAIVIPISSVRIFFLIIALLLILIPWMIYNKIRRAIRRTVGDIGRYI